MTNRIIATITIAITLSACGRQADTGSYKMEQEHLVTATIWFQKSPEAKALYYQGFNIAKERVREQILEPSSKPRAVIVDIDETMVDNSPFQGMMIESGSGFTSELWGKWVSLEAASALPGAVEFTHFCQSLGVEVFYISNRTVNEQEATMRNMQKLGFAYVKPENFLLKTDKSGKEPRREQVASRFDVILLLGDNLNDFAEVFENRGDDWGISLVDELRNEFGLRFIVFPNPLYGEWEKNVFNHKKVSNPNQQMELRRKAIVGF